MTSWPSSAIAAAWGAPRWPQPITDTRMPVLLVRGQWAGGAHRMRCAPVKLQSVTDGGGVFPRNGDAEPVTQLQQGGGSLPPHHDVALPCAFDGVAAQHSAVGDGFQVEEEHLHAAGAGAG